MGGIRFHLIYTLVSSLLTAYTQPSHQRSINVRQSDDLIWGPCGKPLPWEDGTSLVCANFTVPLDWTNASDGHTAVLYVTKLRTSSDTPLGTIYTNPGGPGGSGLNLLTGSWSQLIFNITGRNFDIVSWDPRGVGLTSPSINCFGGGANETLEVFLQNLIDGAFNTGSSVLPSDIDRFLANATNVETFMKAFVQKCVDNNQDNLKYIGTVATVRDLVALVDAIEGAGSPVRYWGLSYGAIIGSYLMDLFPDRVGRMVLDGIMDATTYTQLPSYIWHGVSIQDADRALQTFYDACAAAGPLLCPIASPGATGASIRQWSNDLIDAAYKGISANSVSITPIVIRTQLSQAARLPASWKFQASTLQALYELVQNGTNGSVSTSKILPNRYFSHLPVNKRQTMDFSLENFLSSRFAIWCGDAADQAGVTTRAVFDEVVRVTKDVSNVDGPIGTFLPSAFCHLWPTRAIERHLDQGSPRLANPVIVIGNTYDNITPLASARMLVKRLTDVDARQAVLVEHGGSGHTSLEMSSACTSDVIRRYFAEGIVPENTLCLVDFDGFI